MALWMMLASGLLLAALTAPAADAQDYPTRPIRLLVPFPPGGPNDILGRVVAQKLSEQLGQQVVIGINMVHVPYKGGGPALTDLLAGQIGIYFSGISSVLPFVKEGRLRGVAVTSARRTAVMPDTPTVAESGLPGYEVGNWYAIVAPAATPRFIITRLNNEIVAALAVPEIRKRFLELAADPVGSTPDELRKYNRSELEKWAKVIKSAGIKPE